MSLLERRGKGSRQRSSRILGDIAATAMGLRNADSLSVSGAGSHGRRSGAVSWRSASTAGKWDAAAAAVAGEGQPHGDTTAGGGGDLSSKGAAEGLGGLPCSDEVPEPLAVCLAQSLKDPCAIYEGVWREIARHNSRVYESVFRVSGAKRLPRPLLLSHRLYVV